MLSFFLDPLEQLANRLFKKGTSAEFYKQLFFLLFRTIILAIQTAILTKLRSWAAAIPTLQHRHLRHQQVQLPRPCLRPQ